ncbi:MAG: hypothetical protein LRS47_04255 [Desulfurococcales archaeon]|nr:hypothetical protein [Desulfurococcales archaeon]
MGSNAVEKLGKALLDFEAGLDSAREELESIANDLLVLAEELVVEIRNEAETAYKMARDKINSELEKELSRLREVYEQRIKDEVKRVEENAQARFEEAVNTALEMIRGAVA